MSKVALTAGNKVLLLDTIDNELTFAADVSKFMQNVPEDVQANMIVREELLTRVLLVIEHSEKQETTVKHRSLRGMQIVMI